MIVSWAIPNFMRAFSLLDESEFQLFQSFHAVGIPVFGQPTHLDTHNHGILEAFSQWFNRAGCTVLRFGFKKALGNVPVNLKSFGP